jgi:hypothetical protein
MSNNLSDKAMLVYLNVSQWTARKYDRSISDKVASDYEAEADSGRYNKLLVAQASLKKVNKIVGNVRTYHYANTLPWDDTGNRLQTAANYPHYTETMREFHGQFTGAVAEFLTVYPDEIENAKRRLGRMFNPSDYPNICEIERRFGFRINVSPLPTSGDLRVTLSDAEIQSIRADIEIRTQEGIDRAMRELWQRLYDSVKHMSDKLSEMRDDGRNGIFRDSLVSNLQELCELLPRLNVTGDTNLDMLTSEVANKLANNDPDTLRNHAPTRTAITNDANAILAAMASYIG